MIIATTTTRMNTIDRQSMTTTTTTNNSTNSNSNSIGKQKVIFQKVVRPTKDLPDILFLGYLIEYLESYFELPSNLPMIYENLSIDEDVQNSGGSGMSSSSSSNRYILAWDSSLSPCSEATRMEVEVVGIYTDDDSNNDNDNSNEIAAAAVVNSSESKTQPTISSVPNMAMVAVRKFNGKSKDSIPPMMEGLFRDSERKIVQALDRGLDDFVAGRIKFNMDNNRAEQRSQRQENYDDQPNTIPPNVKTVEEAIEAELVDDYPQELDIRKQRSPEDVVLDAYATTDNSEDDIDNYINHDTAKRQQRSKSEIADAKARALATMQTPADDVINKQSLSKASVSSGIKNSVLGNDSVDFAVEAAKKVVKVTKKSKKTKIPTNESIDKDNFAVMAARRAAAIRKKKSTSTKSKSEYTNNNNNNNTKGKNSKANSTNIRGTYQEKSRTSENEPKTIEGQPMPPAPEGWKPRDYFKDQRVLSATISRPPTKNKTKRRVTTPKKKQKSMSTHSSSERAKKSRILPTKESKLDERNPSQSPDQNNMLNDSIRGKRNLNIKVVDGAGTDAGADLLLKQARSISDSNKKDKIDTTTSKLPLEENIESEVMKAAKTAMDEIADQGFDMTPEELLKDLLKFDEEKKKEEEPGSGFVSGAFEKAKELMKDRHKQIQERKQQQVSFKEVVKKDSPRPNIVNPNGPDRELTPEEELRAMFAAGQKIADGKITQSTEVDEIGAVKTTGTTEEDVDRLIAEERTVSKYARVLDDELVELEVRINSSPAEQLDGPQQNPIFDVMSGPEVYNLNIEQDAVNYPGAMPNTADVKLPKELGEAIKQAKFATSVLMNLKVVETKDGSGNKEVQYFSGKTELSTNQVENLQTLVSEASASGIIDDPVDLMSERARLQLIVDELWDQPEERFLEIASNFKDLLLSDHLVSLIRDRLTAMADRDLDALRRDDESLNEPHEKERDILGQLVVYAQALLKEVRALGAELEAHQLEIVRSICKVAMDPSHTTEEEAAMALSDAVRDMRPLLDDVFVAYLKYAVAEEESKLARAGLLDDPDHNQWLFVLKIVQQGVYAEIAKGINRYIDHIWYVLRMETPRQRRLLLGKLIDDMPTLDVRPFVQVVDNIVGSLGDGVKGNFDGLIPLGEMTNKLMQLHRDVQEILPPERIAEKSRDADEWAARQKKRLLEQRNIGRQRLQAAKETSHRDDEIEQLFGTGGGEVDVFD